MARNSKGRSGQKKKTSTSNKSKSSKTSTQKHVECQEDEKDDIWSIDEEEELVTPKSELLHTQTKVQLKPNFTEWMNSIREKHPVSKMGNIQEDIRPIVLDETVTMQVGMIEHNNADKQGDDLVHITMDDIQPEVDYWKPSIVSFVIGANPPGKVMEGFFRRHLDIDVTQDEIKRIPIWVHMELNFKYWGAKCLEKIVKPVGTLIKVNNVTAQREKLQYARCMIEVEINQKFPMAVQFLNEKNEITNVPITYEWKPEICSKCKRMGHESQQCVAATTQFKLQKKWVQKGKSNEVQKSIPTKTTSQRQKKLGDKGVSRERGQQPEPMIHYAVQPRSGLPEFFCSFIYAHNDAKARELLWKDLDRANDKLDGPWMIMGDFNCVLNIDEKIGNAVRAGEMEAARVMANDQWLEVYKGMNAIFLAEGCSDHSPALLRMNQGCHPSDPHDAHLIEQEKNADKEYRARHKAYMQFLRQKEKIDWVKEGDENSALFHSSIRKRRIHNIVYTIKDKVGVFHDTPDGVQEAFLDYYQELLGSNIRERRPVQREVVQTGLVVNEEHKVTLTSPFTPADVKKIVFSLNGDKAPGRDGFGAHFFKHNWDIIGEDTTKAVLSFFESGRLLKEVNNTFISLVPKVSCPQDVTEFRPIACCNTIYKIITKLLCLRLKEVLPDLISENQGAFVHGRYIIHNIMVYQDLVRKYGRKNVSPSCMIKVDLRKAYDTVEWRFVQEMLEALNFPQKFRGWIMTCVTTLKYFLWF
ncbi:hypothetical protein RDABS01_016354 [Bienertia sinuspersici]